MENTEIYPINIFGIKRLGLEKWFDSYDPPVSDKDYQEIYVKVFAAYEQAFMSQKDSLSYLMGVCCYKRMLLISDIAFECLLLNKLEQRGVRIIAGKEDISVTEALSSRQNSKELGTPAIFDTSLKSRGRNLFRQLKTNRHGFALFEALTPHLSSRKCFLLGSADAKEVKAFCKSGSDEPLVIYPGRYISNCRARYTAEEQKALEDAVDNFLELLKTSLPQEATGFIGKSCAESLKSYFNNALFTYNSFLAALSIWKHLDNLLITGIGNIYHRLFASAWRKRGGTTIGFSHGNPYYISYEPNLGSGAYHAVLDRYIANSEGEASLVRDGYRDFQSSFSDGCQVEVSPINPYQKLFNDFQQKPEVKSIRKVMLVGFPMAAMHHPFFPEYEPLSRLAFELETVKELKKQGHHVIYKTHPDTVEETSGIFEQYVDEICTERFEDCWDVADCFIFHYDSTALGFAMFSKHPIVFINVEGTPIHPDVLALMRKRCRIVDAQADGQGRIKTDFSKLKNAIENSLTNIDYELIKKYAL